jgi:hypothetical protein
MRTVLNGGCVKTENGISSAPVTETSSGTRMPDYQEVAAFPVNLNNWERGEQFCEPKLI